MEAEGTMMTTSYFDGTMRKARSHHEQSKGRSSGYATSATGTHQSSPAVTSFDCSICLDLVVDPVVTLCGHLYCWPCIYKWLNFDTTASSSRRCPVCKSPVSQASLVPLYGRDAAATTNNNVTKNNKGLDKIPSRPGPGVVHRAVQPEHHHHHHHYYPSPWSTSGGVLGGLAIAILPFFASFMNNGTQGDNQEQMHLARMNQFMRIDGNNMSESQRLREKRVENSLHQIWAFLFCCCIFWLFLF